MSIGHEDDDEEVLNLDDGGDGAGEDRGDEHESEDDEDRGDEVDDDAAIEELAAQVDGKDEPKGKAKDDDGEEEEEDDKRRVPYSRFKEQNAELKELRERLAVLEGKTKSEVKEEQRQAEKDEVDVKALIKARNAAILEGDEDKAAELEEKIEAHRLEQAELRAEARIQLRELKRDVDAVAAKAFEKYPFLDHSSKDANKEAIEEVREWRDFYVSKGDAWPKALQKAVDKVAKTYAKPEKNDDDGDGKKPDKVAEKKIESIKRNAETKIPPKTGGASGGDRKVDVSRLSEREFNDLSAEEKRRLRGDVA